MAEGRFGRPANGVCSGLHYIANGFRSNGKGVSRSLHISFQPRKCFVAYRQPSGLDSLHTVTENTFHPRPLFMPLDDALTRTGDPTDVSSPAAVRVVVAGVDIPFGQVFSFALKFFIAGAVVGLLVGFLLTTLGVLATP